MIGRLGLLARRFMRARAMGVWFLATKSFKLPTTFLIGDRQVHLNAPIEQGITWDFINVMLDDEYGLSSIASPPSTILDIGANIGLFSLWAKRNFPDCTIHAYEPNPRVVAFAKTNLAQLDRVQVFDEAIGAEVGFATIADGSESRLGQVTIGTSQGIRVTSLADAVSRLGGWVDLLKLDCEGAEWDIFNNPDPFRNIRLIRMEYHLTDNRTLADLKTAVDSIGFKIDCLHENLGFGIAWLSHR